MTQGRILLSALVLPAFLTAALAVPAQAQPRPLPPGPGQAPPQQQQPPKAAPPRPYREIPVTLPTPSNDPSFAAFRKQLGEIAMRKDRAALARVTVGSNFFWMGEQGDKADKRKSSIDNLAAAIDLNAKDDSGWAVLGHAAEETTLEPIQQRPGVSCSPATPMFDEKLAETVAKNTGTEPSDWAFPTKDGAEVHATAQPNSPIIGKLGMHLIRVMEEEPPPGGQPPQTSFVRIVTPAGKVGFVDEQFLSALSFDQLCYMKDASGWRIAGYAGNE